MDFYFEELKNKDLSWHWNGDRRCLYLRYKFGIINKKNPDFSNVGFIAGPNKKEKYWYSSVYAKCYCDETKKSIILNKEFKPYDAYDNSLEEAKFKIELLLLDWF